MRIFAVTGTGWAAVTTAWAMRARRGKSRSNAHPPFLHTTLFTGQPKLRSTKIRLYPVDDGAGGFSEVLRISPEQLDAEGTLFFEELEIVPGPRISMQDSLGGHEFRGENICPLALQMRRKIVFVTPPSAQKQWKVRRTSATNVSAAASSSARDFSCP